MSPKQLKKTFDAREVSHALNFAVINKLCRLGVVLFVVISQVIECHFAGINCGSPSIIQLVQ